MKYPTSLPSLPPSTPTSPLFLAAARQPSPDVTALKGKHFTSLKFFALGKAPYLHPNAAWHSCALSTTSRQLDNLEALKSWICLSPLRLETPLVNLVLQFLAARAQTGRSVWRPQTFFRELTLMEGAMKNLGKFLVDNSDISLQLAKSAIWRSAKKAWERQAMVSQPIHQSAATFADIKEAVNRNTDSHVRAFLMLLWLLCARKGDVARLQTNAVTLEPSGRLTASIRQGKGVLARRGLYQVVSECPPEWRQELNSFLSAPRPENATFLFRKSLGANAEINNALKMANPSLTTRSVRRGALQCIAKDPKVDEATLMKMSGHKRVETLHRYLDWDRINERSHSKVQLAARNLAKETTPSA